MRARGTFNLASLSGLAQVWHGRGDTGIFLIGLATLPVGLPLRVCPGFSLVLTFPRLQLHRGIFLFILGQGLILLPQYHQLDGIDSVFYKGNKLSYYAWTKSKY